MPSRFDPELMTRAAIEAAERLGPEWRRQRASAASRSRNTPDYHLRKLSEQLASLTGEQRHRLVELALAANAEQGRRLAELALAASGGDGDG